jgi:hypothetical protein
MGMSNAVCAMSAVPLWREAFAFLVTRVAEGRWEPLSAVSTVGLDDYQRITDIEPGTPSLWLSLAASVWPDAEDLLEELVQHRIEEMPVQLGKNVQVALALVEPSMARALVQTAGPAASVEPRSNCLNRPSRVPVFTQRVPPSGRPLIRSSSLLRSLSSSCPSSPFEALGASQVTTSPMSQRTSNERVPAWLGFPSSARR